MLKAGIFRHAGVAVEGEAATSNMEVEEGDEGSGGRREDTVEISSEYSGPVRSRSEDELEGEGEHEHEDDDGDGDGDDGDHKNKKKKKRKKYHRHTAEQIREMEACV